MTERIVEICAGGYGDCLAAFRGGAKRVELNSALSVGGLSPSLSVLRRVKAETDLQVICMVRPRAAGFCYDEEETAIMLDEASLFLSEGADGIAFGFLNADKTVDERKTEQMAKLILQNGKEAVFHRAFDITPDADAAMETLLSCGIDRVLTSGQKKTAMEGKELLCRLQKRYGGRIEILAGGGVNAGNAAELLLQTGLRQIHSSCKSYRTDLTTEGKSVSYAYLQPPHTMEYDAVREETVRELIGKSVTDTPF